MNSLCEFSVKEAQDGDELSHNNVFIAPGGKQMKVCKKDEKLVIKITDDDPVNRHRPSVDYLFNSLVSCGPERITAALLTGMGEDGAKGMLNLKNAGASTIAQDEQSCVVYGMPKQAAKLGAVSKVCSLADIACQFLKMSKTDKLSKAS